jgi:hypothetical protein
LRYFVHIGRQLQQTRRQQLQQTATLLQQQQQKQQQQVSVAAESNLTPVGLTPAGPTPASLTPVGPTPANLTPAGQSLIDQMAVNATVVDSGPTPDDTKVSKSTKDQVSSLVIRSTDDKSMVDNSSSSVVEAAEETTSAAVAGAVAVPPLPVDEFHILDAKGVVLLSDGTVLADTVARDNVDSTDHSLTTAGVREQMTSDISDTSKEQPAHCKSRVEDTGRGKQPMKRRHSPARDVDIDKDLCASPAKLSVPLSRTGTLHSSTNVDVATVIEPGSHSCQPSSSGTSQMTSLPSPSSSSSTSSSSDDDDDDDDDDAEPEQIRAPSAGSVLAGLKDKPTMSEVVLRNIESIFRLLKK